ncbi:MAG: DUF3465 domain-containing protein [Desulfobacteraceae bacterium]|nr:DUF3465 domain-containing protein [Desulfobacteraceae bacterium]MBU4054135.1 DUF3465 domain-containing protein [Pseudomonadota bacterium]
MFFLITFRDISCSNANIANAFSDHKSNIQVSGQGVITNVLPDDNTESRHQKFIPESCMKNDQISAKPYENPIY